MNRKLVILACVIFVILFVSVSCYVAYTPIYEADVDMQIVYARFADSSTGDTPSGYTAVSYVVVLKVTNHASQPAFIKIANIIAGEKIVQTSNTSWSFTNPQIIDQDTGQLLHLNSSGNTESSKLIAITGITNLSNLTIPLDVQAHVIVKPPSEKGKTDEHFAILNSADFQPVNGGYLYNTLLSGNQKLVIEGSKAHVVDG